MHFTYFTCEGMTGYFEGWFFLQLKNLVKKFMHSASSVTSLAAGGQGTSGRLDTSLVCSLNKTSILS